MKSRLTVYFTSDSHGFLFPTNYFDRAVRPMGLTGLIGRVPGDGNTLLIDGGDAVQGSPLTYYCHEKDVPCPIADVMNAAGYDFVTIGNHDVNYGADWLNAHLSRLEAKCLCANVQDVAGRLPILPWTVRTLENGLRIGVAGVCTDWILHWERPENLQHFAVSEALEAARRAYAALREISDFTILIYHGGVERDLETGRTLSTSGENIACAICEQTGFDLLLTGHQHLAIANVTWAGTHLVQAPANAVGVAKVVWGEDGSLTSEILPVLPYARAPQSALDVEHLVQKWLDAPVGRLNIPLTPGGKLEMALGGTPIANFINQVQLSVSGADLSSTSLANDVRGFDRSVTVRDVVSTYIYPNTLVVLEITGAQLRQMLERVAAYFHPTPDGLSVSDDFLRPKVAHYNYDFLLGLFYAFELSNPIGRRVIAMEREGRPIRSDDTLTLCVNNYRATGVGGYDMLKACRRVREIQTEVAELLLNCFVEQGDVSVDPAPPYCVYWRGVPWKNPEKCPETP